MQKHLPLCFGLILIATAGCHSGDKLSVGGGQSQNSEHPGFVFGSPNLIQLEGQPGLLFSWVQGPNGEKTITYCFLFRHQKNTEFSYSDQLNDHFDQQVSIQHDERKLEVVYRSNPQSKSELNSTMTIGGQQIDLKQGKLFLVGDEPHAPFKQIVFEFPTTTEKLDQLNEIEKFAANLLRQFQGNRQIENHLQ